MRLSAPFAPRPAPVRLEDFKKGKAVSRRYRNRRIGEFLKELDLTEGRSTGISKIIKAMAKNGSPAPEFETDDERSYFLIRLPVHEKAAWVEEDVEATLISTKSALSRHQVEILRKSQVASAIGDLMSIVGRADRTKFRNQVLKPLLDSGWIEMTVPEKPTSRLQKYRLTALGGRMLEDYESENRP